MILIKEDKDLKNKKKKKREREIRGIVLVVNKGSKCVYLIPVEGTRNQWY